MLLNSKSKLLQSGKNSRRRRSNRKNQSSSHRDSVLTSKQSYSKLRAPIKRVTKLLKSSNREKESEESKHNDEEVMISERGLDVSKKLSA